MFPPYSHQSKNKETGGGPKMVEEQDGETTFFPTRKFIERTFECRANSTKQHLNAGIMHPERQPIIFERRLSA